MKTKELMDIRENYRRYVDENGLYAGRGYAVLDRRCLQLFGNAGGLEGKSMLEIGGGEGLFSLWALVNGLEKVVLLEPEAAGSTAGVRKRLMKHRKALNISDESLVLYPVTIQKYLDENEAFDLVLSYSSINHLDEQACIFLNQSESARMRYLKIFKKAYAIMRSGGHFIISDSGRFNFWNSMGLTSPFAPSIEWKKHQDPSLWKQLLNKVGFEFVALDWHRFYPLRWLGPLGLNYIISRATTSQFILTVHKPC